jgi:hypothetical protein
MLKRVLKTNLKIGDLAAQLTNQCVVTGKVTLFDKWPDVPDYE